MSIMSRLKYAFVNSVLGLQIAQMADLQSPKNSSRRMRRNAVVYTYFRWPKGVIPFTFDPTYNETEQLHILTAMNEFHAKTCVRFVPRRFQQDYLSIIRFRGYVHSTIPDAAW